ncbi:hypothetical protein [Dyella sp. 2RAB6]|uniref:hypothetical protein n=1 Tax=Dyella sp. 2RAB6 TaxID=3232992 RepID=UPI003F8F96A5
MFQLATPPADHISDCASADPYAVRFAVVGGKNDPDEAPRLAIRLPVSSTATTAETFLLTLMAASSRRTIWTLRHVPTYWRIAPLDIPLFRLCQAAMSSLRVAKAQVEWLLAPVPEASAAPATALYFQEAPNAPFVLLSRNAARPVPEWQLSYAD